MFILLLVEKIFRFEISMYNPNIMEVSNSDENLFHTLTCIFLRITASIYDSIEKFTTSHPKK